MPKRWLQVKGDPSVRAFLFDQSRQSSLFDEKIDELNQVIFDLTVHKGVFHIKAHYSSSQLTCWFFDDPYNYRVYVKDEIFKPGFMEGFPNVSYESRKPRMRKSAINRVLEEFKRLRHTDEQIYLRAGSFNRINGMIGMNFSCDGSHYLDHEEFFSQLSEFGSPS